MKLFETAESCVKLDPEFDYATMQDLEEEDRAKHQPNPEKEAKMKLLREWNRLTLLRPKDNIYMYHAALYSDEVALTPRGKMYHDLVLKKQV